MALPEHEALVMTLDRSPDRATISTGTLAAVTANRELIRNARLQSARVEQNSAFKPRH
jgi:hypothetical protein